MQALTGAQHPCVGLVVFVLVPSFGEVGLLGIGDTLEVVDYIVMSNIDFKYGLQLNNVKIVSKSQNLY